MKHVIDIFLRAEGTRPWLVLFCLLLAALTEAVGIGSLLPAITLIAGRETGAKPSPLEQSMLDLFGTLGIAPTLGTLVLIIIGALILKAAISFGTLTYAGISASRVSVRMRQRLVGAIFGANWKFYSDQHSGNFANAISNDATRAGEAYLLAANFVSLAVQAVLYSAIAIFMDWRLALIGTGVGAIMAGALNSLVRITKRSGVKQTDRTRRLTMDVVDMLSNIKPLKTMHRYQPLMANLQRTMVRLQRALTTREIAKQALTQGGDAIMAAAVGGVVYTAYNYYQVPLSQLLVGGLIFLKVVQNVQRMQRMLQQAIQVESAYTRLTELIKLSESSREVRSGTAEPRTDADCRFEDVSFAHGDKQVLTHVDLTIPARGITVLKGPSGAGKTTLIDLFIGLYEPMGGRILLGEVPLTEIDVTKLRRRIGYVPQELSLLHSTVRENITLGDDKIPDADVMAALDLAGAREFIDSLPDGLDTDVGETGGKLSGGQRQRISLARALVTKPSILILDEVTSALDPSTEAEIVRNVLGLSQKFTIIVITHREAWAEIADRLYEVRDGTATLVEAGEA